MMIGRTPYVQHTPMANNAQRQPAFGEKRRKLNEQYTAEEVQAVFNDPRARQFLGVVTKTLGLDPEKVDATLAEAKQNGTPDSIDETEAQEFDRIMEEHQEGLINVAKKLFGG